jgi:HK97 family phage major capsid protein
MYIIIPVSKLVYTSQQDAVDAILAEAELGIGEGLDREILRGVDGVFSTYATQSGVLNVASTSDYYADISNVFNDVEDAGYTVSGLVARSSEKAAFRNARADSGAGVPLFTPSTDANPGLVFGAPVEFVRAGDANAPLRSGSTTGTVRLVAGDWRRGLALGVYGVTDIEINPYGSGWTTNEVELRVELYCGFAVKDPTAFAYLKQG